MPMSASSTPAAPRLPGRPVFLTHRGAADSCGPFTALPTAAPRRLPASHLGLRRRRRGCVPVHVACRVGAVTDEDRGPAAQDARMPRLAPHHVAEADDQSHDEYVRGEV